MIKCPECGVENLEGATYCKSCGSSLMVVEAPTKPVPAIKPVPGVKVIKPITPPTGVTVTPTRVPAIGSCFYHRNLPAAYICSRCGRSICRDCSQQYQDLVLCPQCYTVVPPVAPKPARPLIAFLASLSGGILILINAMIIPWYLDSLTEIFSWMAVLDSSALMMIGMVSAALAILGALLIYQPGYENIGVTTAIVSSLLGILIGGGFLAGTVLGVVGAILVLLR